MARMAVIKNGVVVGVIMADLEVAQTLGYDAVVEVTEEYVGPGFAYDGASFIAPPEPPADPLPPPDHNAAIQAQIDAIVAQAKGLPRIQWESQLWLYEFYAKTEGAAQGLSADQALAYLRAHNKGYVLLKDTLLPQVLALEAQLV